MPHRFDCYRLLYLSNNLTIDVLLWQTTQTKSLDKLSSAVGQSNQIDSGAFSPSQFKTTWGITAASQHFWVKSSPHRQNSIILWVILATNEAKQTDARREKWSLSYHLLSLSLYFNFHDLGCFPWSRCSHINNDVCRLSFHSPMLAWWSLNIQHHHNTQMQMKHNAQRNRFRTEQSCTIQSVNIYPVAVDVFKQTVMWTPSIPTEPLQWMEMKSPWTIRRVVLVKLSIQKLKQKGESLRRSTILSVQSPATTPKYNRHRLQRTMMRVKRAGIHQRKT